MRVYKLIQQHVDQHKKRGSMKETPSPDTREIERLNELCDKLRMEAQCHAQEARTANAIIYEIYQIVSNGTGEPGNWHGAQPVKKEIARLKAVISALNKDGLTDAVMNAVIERDQLKAELAQATQREQRLREALQLLHDHQNGCPLPKYEKDWNRAMELTKQALTETKKPLPDHGL